MRPAPVVTISDPLHPARLARYDEPARVPEAARWTGAERLVAVLSAVLLLTGIAVARDLRRAERLTAVVAGLQLHAAATASVTVASGGALWVVLDVDLSADPRHDLHLAAVTADQGWAVQPGAPGTLYAGATIGLALRRRLECVTPLLRPQQLALRLAFAGDRHRTVTVPVRPESGGDLPRNDYLCGQADAVHTLQLVSAEITWAGPRSVVDLQLADVGLAPLTVRGVEAGGFSFSRSAPLPLVLRGREPGPLDPARLRTRDLVLDARVLDCRVARATLDAVALEGARDRVLLTVSGRGGGGVAGVSVGGWGRYLEEQWQLACA